MKTSMTGKILMMLMTIILVAGGCSKEGKTTVKKLGPAGEAVQSFFKNWEFERYAKMHAQTVHSRSEEIFVKNMKETPIRWRNIAILSEDPSGDDWIVTLSVEVTDIPCAFAACILNLEYPPVPSSKLPAFYMTPEFLGIQKFMSVKQTWKVVNLNGEYLIDICAAGSKGKRHENIMNYVLDASNLDTFLPGNKQLSAASWLVMVMMDTDTPTENAEDIMKESAPLIVGAKQSLRELLKKFDSLL